jgi:hypothetical protein
LLAGAMAHRLLGVEKTHEIGGKNGPNGVIVRRKMKKFICKRSAVAIALNRVSSNLNDAETRMVRVGLVK